MDDVKDELDCRRRRVTDCSRQLAPDYPGGRRTGAVCRTISCTLGRRRYRVVRLHSSDGFNTTHRLRTTPITPYFRATTIETPFIGLRPE